MEHRTRAQEMRCKKTHPSDSSPVQGCPSGMRRDSCQHGAMSRKLLRCDRLHLVSVSCLSSRQSRHRAMHSLVGAQALCDIWEYVPFASAPGLPLVVSVQLRIASPHNLIRAQVFVIFHGTVVLGEVPMPTLSCLPVYRLSPIARNALPLERQSQD